MKRKLAIGLIVLIALGMSGCETLPKKFIRKKKEPKHRAAVMSLDQGPFEKQFSNEYYYKTHYTFWKTWHDDMIANVAGNSKKLKRASEEAYSHLEQMNRYLKPEKQAGLAPLVEELDRYRQRFAGGTPAKGEAGSLSVDLERIQRLVANDFYYEKVKDDLIADVVDLGEAQTP